MPRFLCPLFHLFDSQKVVAKLVGLVVTCSTAAALAISCPVAGPHTPSDAEAAFLKGDYDKATTLYQAQLQAQPNDNAAIGGLVEVLLRQQKVADAIALVQKGLAASPKAVVLMNANADVLYRHGTPWLAGTVAEDTFKEYPCNARNHLMRAKLFRLNSLYASEQKELRLAHQLDPYDPAIRRAWIGTLSTRQRIAELEAYLASPTGDDAEDIRHMQMYLETLKKRLTEPHKACRLASPVESTKIPFALLMRDATHVRAFGLEVKLNDHKARLEIDTGATGLLVSRSVAERAGLKPFVENEVGGIGAAGEKKAYSAYADKIQIGSLEFHDCMVEVLDSRNVMDESDGLIGMDVLSGFLVTLDYPQQQLELGPLPPRPTETGPQTPTLKTGEGTPEEEEGDSSPSANTSSQNGDKDAAAKAPAPAPAPAAKGPYDRYIAPEMASYNKVFRVGHQLMIPTALNQPSNPPKLFILDTGSFSTTISPEAAREVTKLRGDDRMTVHGISGKVEKVYSADNVTFYFASLAQPGRDVVSFDISNISKGTGLEVSGLIGATTLGQLTMHIDYRDGLVKFDYDPKRPYRRMLPN
jgi:clan AA aspartic protease (TIGR02281 family)